MNLFAKRSARTVPGNVAFQLRPVAAGCAVFMALAAHAAFAQEQAAQEQEQQTTSQAVAQTGGDAAANNGNAGVQTVKVTGIRRGIEAAIAVKKNNDSIVEAISAEDIGKLPDQSIAESIARLPGVTAQNVRGQASVISIRGMSPDFSTGLLNGREQVSTGDSRSVEFDNYPAELLSGVVVYKTPDGALVGQGLSGTVDMQTVRPLDFKERTMAVNYRRQKTGLGMETQGTGNRMTYSYIDQFANRTIGVAFGFSRLQAKSGDTTRFGSWGNDNKDRPVMYNGQVVNIPYNGFEAWTDKSNEDRNGFMGVLQFRPNRDFNSTVDLFYTRYNRDTRTYGIQMPLYDAPTTLNPDGRYNTPTGVPYDQPGQLVNPTLSGSTVTAGTFNNVMAVVRNNAEAFSDVTKSIGWNNKLKVNQDWTAVVDLSFNTAERNGTNIETYGGTGRFDTVGFTAGSQLFTPTQNYADPAAVRLTDVLGWGGQQVQAAYVKAPHVYDKINAIRFDAIRELPEGMFFSKLNVGANFSNRSKTRSYVEALGSLAGATDPRASVAFPAGSGSGEAGRSGIDVLTFDPVANIGMYDLLPKQHPDITNKDWTVREKVETAFAKLSIDSEIASIPVRGALGLQAIHTHQESTAFSVDKDGGTSDADRPTAPVTLGTSYNDVLPSLNLIGDLGNQQSLRFAVMKIMARPTLNDLRASGSFGLDATRNNTYGGSGGNPQLKPFRAKGVDLSYEKYWGNKAYVSAATFYRKLDTYVLNVGHDFDFTPYIQAGTAAASSPIGTYTSPVNGSGGNIKGVELAASLPLNVLTRYLDGFGVVANAAQTSSSVTPPDTANGGSGSMPLPGLSRRVASLTLYYEKNGFSARVADRYRSDFVGQVANNYGDQQLTYIQGGSTVDLQLGYEFQTGRMKGLSILVEMSNVNDAPYKEYRKTKDNVITDTHFGRTVLYGLNYKF